MSDKIWANSGDSHFIEPAGLWHEMMPKALADRMPRSERIGDTEEIVHVDGKQFRRQLPKLASKKDKDGLTIGDLVMRPPGARDLSLRMKDLDEEGIWAEIVFSSLGLLYSDVEYHFTRSHRGLLRPSDRACSSNLASRGAHEPRPLPRSRVAPRGLTRRRFGPR